MFCKFDLLMYGFRGLDFTQLQLYIFFIDIKRELQNVRVWIKKA